MTGPKPIGRPKKAAEPGSRVSLGIKVTANLKSRLDQAASQNGRTQSKEAERRLEASFDREDLLGYALSLKFDSAVAGLLLAAAGVMVSVGRHVAMNRHAAAQGGWIGLGHDWAQDWINDPVAYGLAVKSITTFLEAARPPGDRTPSADDIDALATIMAPRSKAGEPVSIQDYLANAPASATRAMVRTLRGETEGSRFRHDAAEVKVLLGELVDRLAEPELQDDEGRGEHG